MFPCFSSNSTIQKRAKHRRFRWGFHFWSKCKVGKNSKGQSTPPSVAMIYQLVPCPPPLVKLNKMIKQGWFDINRGFNSLVSMPIEPTNKTNPLLVLKSIGKSQYDLLFLPWLLNCSQLSLPFAAHCPVFPHVQVALDHVERGGPSTWVFITHISMNGLF